MQAVNKVLALVEGKKSYIIAVLTVIIGVLQGNSQLTLQGLAVAALRRAIATK